MNYFWNLCPICFLNDIYSNSKNTYVLFLFCNCLTYDSCTIKFNLGWTPGLGRSLGEGEGYPLHYSGLENPMNSIVRRVSKSQTWLNDLTFTFSSLQDAIFWVWTYFSCCRKIITSFESGFDFLSSVLPPPRKLLGRKASGNLETMSVVPKQPRSPGVTTQLWKQRQRNHKSHCVPLAIVPQKKILHGKYI